MRNLIERIAQKSRNDLLGASSFEDAAASMSDRVGLKKIRSLAVGVVEPWEPGDAKVQSASKDLVEITVPFSRGFDIEHERWDNRGRGWDTTNWYTNSKAKGVCTFRMERKANDSVVFTISWYIKPSPNELFDIDGDEDGETKATVSIGEFQKRKGDWVGFLEDMIDKMYHISDIVPRKDTNEPDWDMMPGGHDDY